MAARTTQAKFEAQMVKLADDNGLEAIIDNSYSNIGSIAFQHEDAFYPVLRFTFDHQTGYSSFQGEEIGHNPNGGRWSYVVHGAPPSESHKWTLDDFVGHVSTTLKKRLDDE